MLQIDDAGSGSFVGGTCIGVYRPETNEYYFVIIPVELYNKENFRKKLYLDEVVRITESAMKNLSPYRGETIEICRGYMFEKLKDWLEQNHHTWYCTQITGRVQEIVEKNFELYTQRLGLPWQYIKYTRYPFHFHKLLKWVYSDFDNRIRHCKVGWKSWQKLEGIVPEVAYGSILSPAFTCLKCGRHIKQGSPVKILTYASNQTNHVYLHPDC
jgi:hypothetical protein